MNAALANWVAAREAALAQVRTLLIEKLDVRRAPDEIDPDTPLFGTGLGLDSIDAVELIITLEAEFGVQVSNEFMGRADLRTVNSLVDAILRRSADAAGAR